MPECSGGQGENHQHLNNDSWSLDRVLKQEPSEYEVGVLADQSVATYLMTSKIAPAPTGYTANTWDTFSGSSLMKAEAPINVDAKNWQGFTSVPSELEFAHRRSVALNE
jgi:hypothetical protein